MDRQRPDDTQAPMAPAESSNKPHDNTVSERGSEVNSPPRTSSLLTPSLPARTSARQYLFIDQLGDRRSSNEAVRVHVMRESHRAKRQLRGLRQSDSQQIQDQMTIMQTPRSLPLSTRTASASEETSFDVGAEDESVIADDLATSNARSLVDLRRLAGQYTSVLSSTQRAVLELCKNSAAALSAFLAVEVLQNPGIGTDTPQIMSAELESQALVTVRSTLTTSHEEDHDAISLTIALLSRLERQRGNDETAGFHEAALQRMIQMTGGVEALSERNAALAQDQSAQEQLGCTVEQLPPAEEASQE